MADIHIERHHGMSLAQARKIAFKWAEQAEEKFDMECTYQEGSTLDEVSFKRSGVTGTLTVSKDAFELQAKLGFLLGAFKDKIEGEIVKNLDALIAKGATSPKTAKVTTPGAAQAKKTPAKKSAVQKA
jgi:putative polyhydroxyalkanoate system protein